MMLDDLQDLDEAKPPLAPGPMSRERVIRAALAIVDRDGLGALNIRHLASTLQVTGGLLYHYVDSKADILEAVAMLVLQEVRVPPPNGDWRAWAIELTRSFRGAFVRHPNVLPLMMDGLPRRLSIGLYAQSAQVLADGGVPRELISTVMEGLEAIAIGHAMYSTASLRGAIPNFGDAEENYSALHSALSAVTMSAEERFHACIIALLDGFVPPDRNPSGDEDR
ncbi:TetR/AcrR family transcriptional regulator [Micromonospora sp. HUAS LYJ1]|uniref:TetR/AcrR family transcriptional regulator n=1 Tax=Micromonospora sp. HUAS LYJ1 TaxID=3061626 RepID=UPI002673D407|nr:TetR family transcriptional regulator [Micromonospora sp. HUAS LYJ1]WKU03544.1 TetR family transcriptional regulator [Micromonospora sp. HUAS LYJ1]